MNNKLYKVTDKMLESSNYNLKLSYSEAIKKQVVIAFSESQFTSWIYELRGTTQEEASSRYSFLKGQLKQGKGNTKELQREMHEIIFMNELVQVEFNSQRTFDKAMKGFKVNGISYKFLASKGSNTITFIREDLYDIVSERLNAGRNANAKQFASKLNAYRSLVFSSSMPVTTPKNVIVIDDCEVEFQEKYLWVAEEITAKDEIVTRTVSDGYGFIDPQLAEVWTKDLNHDGILSAYQIRTLWSKGILVPVDYKHFCESKGVTTVKDIWGHEQNILEADIVLCGSLVKLWSSYDSCEEWLNAINTYKYSWRVSKFSHSPKWGFTNYQQMLPLDLDLDDIDELLEPSIQQLQAISGGDYVSTCLYLNGNQDENMLLGDKSLATALQIEPALINDVYLKRRISTMISKTKNDIKLGRMSVNASFQIIVGDVVQLLEHLIGIENPKGVLGRYEVYSYHHEEGTVAVASRCPLLVANNLVKVTTRKDMGEYNKYFEHLKDVYVTDGCSLINESLCGFDFDGDTLQLITEDVIIRNTKDLLPIKCDSISGKKEVINNDEPLIKASRMMCGKSIPMIGAVINDASKMFSVMSRFEVGSAEYEEMNSRLIQMVKISQSVIDAKKSGCYFKTPKHWVSADACKEMFTGEELEFNLRLVADKRPYFFIHNYDKDKAGYKKFKDMVEMYSVTHWNLNANQLLNMSEDELTDEQKQYLDYAMNKYCELSINDDSTMWVLTNRAEDRLKAVNMSVKGSNCKDLLKSNAKVTKTIMNQVEVVYNIYIEKVKYVLNSIKNGLIDKDEKMKLRNSMMETLQDEVLMELLQIADREVVCNALIEITYKKGHSCTLMWDLFGTEIIQNLLAKNNYEMNVIVQDSQGEHEFKSNNYTVKKVQIQK